jgi:outer membrane protein TolC
MAESDDTTPNVEALRSEVADVKRRLATIEAALRALFGDGVLGGPRPTPQPEPEPEPTPRRSRLVATIGGRGPNGFVP